MIKLHFVNRSLLFCCMVMSTACNNRRQGNSPATGQQARIVVDSAGWPASFGFGHAADTAMIAGLDIDVRPDGKGLPQGGGNAIAGRLLYAAKCMACHGGSIIPPGVKLPGPPLINNPDSPAVKTIGNYWPYATTIFDYIRRTMPYNAPGSLSNNEVYALTAYLLHSNKLLDSVTTVNAYLLPKIILPAQKRFVADDRKAGQAIK